MSSAANPTSLNVQDASARDAAQFLEDVFDTSKYNVIYFSGASEHPNWPTRIYTTKRAYSFKEPTSGNLSKEVSLVEDKAAGNKEIDGQETVNSVDKETFAVVIGMGRVKIEDYPLYRRGN